MGTALRTERFAFRALLSPKRPRLLAEMEAARCPHRAASFGFKDENSGNHLLWHAINPRAVNSVSAAPALLFLGGSAGTTKEALSHPSPSPEGRASNLPPDQAAGGSLEPFPSAICM